LKRRWKSESRERLRQFAVHLGDSLAGDGQVPREPLSHSIRRAPSSTSSSTVKCRSPAGRLRVRNPRGESL